MYSKNSLLLKGNETEIRRFVEQAKYVDEDGVLVAVFSFSKLIPMPSGLSNEDGWKWWEETWGVTCDFDVFYDAKKQKYYFDCDQNFAPIIKGFLKISKQFPQIKFVFECLNFDYEDGSLANHAKIEFCNGLVSSEVKDQARIFRCLHCNLIDSLERVEQ